MIVVKLMGGLGNQMFQYAAGRALSIKHNAHLLLDESFLNQDPGGAYTRRSPELAQLKINARVAKAEDLKSFEPKGLWKKLTGKTSIAGEVLNEGEGLDSGFFKAGSKVYLNGFWQSEAYFSSCREVLLKEFQPNYTVSQKTKEYLDRIKSCLSVSLHVRRGDYISHPGANKFHGSLGSDYYLTAIDLMRSKTGDCHFFIFSDDIRWCKQQFKELDNATFVENDDDHSFSDLYLMKHCNHHIIANSSYSWWGAWLGTEGASITIAPAKWLLAEIVSTEKIYCKNWIKI